MVHHLWYGSFDAEAEDARSRPWRNTHTRQPAPRRGGARGRSGEALIDIGERIASDGSTSLRQQARPVQPPIAGRRLFVAANLLPVALFMTGSVVYSGLPFVGRKSLRRREP